MAITYNGNTISSVTYNGNELNKVTYNGNTVWEKGPSETLYCTVSGLGSVSPSSVTFTDNTIKDWTPDIVTLGSDVFIKFPKFYRKVISTSSGQITSFRISDSKVDSTYEVYPCFLKEDGVTEMDYVLMGKYCCSSSSQASSVDATRVNMTIGTGRTLCQNLGTGYLQMDWQIFKLWQDLLICKMQTINTNSGSGISIDSLGVAWEQQGSKTYPWIDGVSQSDGVWLMSYKPSYYVDSPTSSSSNYKVASYSAPTSSNEISKLGYDSSNKFFNYPNAVVTNSSMNTYYCDRYYYSSDSHPVYYSVGDTSANYGAFYCNSYASWSLSYCVRLCYRPL